MGLTALSRARAAAHWPTAPGRITRSEVTQDTFEGAPTWAATIAYEFEVAGQKLSGTRVGFGDHAGPSAEQAKAIVARWPLGAAVSVRHDPKTPTSAVLEPVRPQLGVWLTAAGALGMAVVALAALAVLLFGSGG